MQTGSEQGVTMAGSRRGRGLCRGAAGSRAPARLGVAWLVYDDEAERDMVDGGRVTGEIVAQLVEQEGEAVVECAAVEARVDDGAADGEGARSGVTVVGDVGVGGAVGSVPAARQRGDGGRLGSGATAWGEAMVARRKRWARWLRRGIEEEE